MKLFEDIGNKIIIIGKLVTILGIGASIVVAIILFAISSNDTKDLVVTKLYEIYQTIAWIVLICGPILSIISGLFICGFGEIVDKTCKIESILQNKKTSYIRTSKPNNSLTQNQQPIRQVQNTIE